MAMRAAAKVAGIGVVNGGRRGFSAENPVAAAAARTATRPASAAISTSDETKSGVFAVVSQNDVVDAGVQRPCWELDEWEFAGAEEEMIVQPRDPMPRLVFGGAPTLQEAKDATSELKDALEKYISLFELVDFRSSVKFSVDFNFVLIDAFPFHYTPTFVNFNLFVIFGHIYFLEFSFIFMRNISSNASYDKTEDIFILFSRTRLLFIFINFR